MSNKTPTSAASTGGAKPRGGIRTHLAARRIATGVAFGAFALAVAIAGTASAQAGTSGTDASKTQGVSATASAAQKPSQAPDAAAEKPSKASGIAAQGSLQVPAEIPASNAACTACHTAEGEAAEDQACLGFLHATLTCETCHDDAQELDELHAKTKAKRMPMRLKKTTVEDETCIACHEVTGEEFVGLASGSLLADANGLEVNAHEVIAGEQHEGIACVSCHEVHDDTLPVEQAQKVCKSCHHAQVFECFTCHEHS